MNGSITTGLFTLLCIRQTTNQSLLYGTLGPSIAQQMAFFGSFLRLRDVVLYRRSASLPIHLSVGTWGAPMSCLL